MMKCNIPNRVSWTTTSLEEVIFRQETANKIAKVMDVMLKLLKPLISDLPDYRDPRYIKYPKEALFLYGIMMFSMKASTRREANRFMTDPIMQENLRTIIPGLDAVAHNDTLANFLDSLDPEIIQEIYRKLIKKLLRNKEFKRLAGRLIVLVDGSGKGSRDWKYSDRALHRDTQEGEIYLTYVLDAVLVLENGMVIPLCTEFLENTGEVFDKQDCETKAWNRMAPKLNKLVGNGAMVIFDGLYASGPVIVQCRKYGWDYIIVLKAGSMPSFTEEAHGLMDCEPSNRAERTVDGRHQVVRWANNVEHMISGNHKYIYLNVVTMEESWTESHTIKKTGPEEKRVIYQWISSIPLNKDNVWNICSLGRNRWLVEINFKTEKHSGYGFGHYFSYNWDLNKAYHYLMKFGHFINVMLMSSCGLTELVSSLGGISGFLAKVKLIFSGAVLDADSIRAAVLEPRRWTLSTTSIYEIVTPPT